MTGARGRHRRTEAAIAAAISAVLSGAFVALIFGGRAQVLVAGSGGLIVDALPQTFMIALMSSLVPTLSTRRRLARGLVQPLHAATRWPRRIAVRVLTIAVGATLLAGALHSVLLPLTPPFWPLPAVLALKLGYGAALGALVAGIAVTAALHDLDRSAAGRGDDVAVRPQS